MDSPFSRGRLVIGLVLVTAIAAVLAYLFGMRRGGPDPGRLVYAGTQGVFVRELESGSEEKISSLPKETTFGAASSDGRWFSYVEKNGTLWLLNLEERRRFQLADIAAFPLGWSPDGKLVARELLDDRDIVLIDPEGGSRVLWSRGSQNLRYPVWLDNDRFAMFDEGQDKSLAIVKLEGSRSSVSHVGAGNPLAASPDGKEILIQRGEQLLVAKLDGNRLVDSRQLFEGTIGSPAVSDQGHVAYTGETEGGGGVWVVRTSAESEKVVSEMVPWLDWSLDGSTILYWKDGAVYALTLPDGKPKRVSNEDVEVFRNQGFTVVQ